MSHPIHNFPPELLAEVLSHTLLTDRNQALLIRHQSALAAGPVAASAVCTSWRRVALAYPNLWSSIRVTIARPDDSTAMVEAIDARIARAGAHALSIDYLEIGKPGPCQALSALIAHSRRWERVTLNLAYTPLACLVPLHDAIPLLRVATITAHLIAAFGMGEKPEVQSMFSTAPLLSSFAFRVPNGEAVELPFVLPWQQLRRYAGPLFTAANPPRYARHLLKHAQELSSTDVISFVPRTRTELPELRSLCAHVQTLAGLVAPALVELRVRGSLLGADVERLFDFLARSNCALRTLCMYAILLGPQGDALVDACGTVEELICAAGRESNAWLGRLPRLRKLTIVAVARPTARVGDAGILSNVVRSGALADILRGRSKNQPELANIDLWFSADCYEAVNTEALHDLVCLGKECGVEVQHHVFTCERGALMDQWMSV